MVTWGRDERVLWRRSGTRIVLTPPDREDSMLLEGTAAVTWLLLDTPIEHTELIGLLADTFDATADTIDAEVAAFLGDLQAIDAVVAS